MIAQKKRLSHRESAASLVKRLNAVPVALRPTALSDYLADCRDGGRRPATEAVPERIIFAPVLDGEDAAPLASADGCAGGGLCANDMLVISEDAMSADEVTQWTHATAAEHALAGGRVVLVYTPGSGSMQLRQFAECTEQVAARTASVEELSARAGGCAAAAKDSPASSREGNGVSDDSFANALAERDECAADLPVAEDLEAAARLVRLRQQRILAAMSRVDAVHCRSVEDLHSFCVNYEMPAEESEEQCESSRRSSLVPLIIVYGCGGDNSYLHRYERAAGTTVPLRHWLLCLLHSRVHGALILVEQVSCVQQQQQERVAGSLSPTDDATQRLSRQSDLVGRLLSPHRHAPTEWHAAEPPAAVADIAAFTVVHLTFGQAAALPYTYEQPLPAILAAHLRSR